MSEFANKVVLITGGSSGIGEAAAKEFHKQGANIVLFARHKEPLSTMQKQLGDRCLTISGDVAAKKDLDHLFLEVQNKFGKIDVLLANAAQAKLSSVAETSEQLYAEVMDVNFKGAYFTVQKALPLLSSGASVIVTTSWLNEIGFAGSSLLSASKAALRSLVRVSAAELSARNIRINAVSPGAISTPLWGKIGLPQDVLKAAGDSITAQIPMKRWGTPDEVAKAILFLASPAASYITGIELCVDGGLGQV